MMKSKLQVFSENVMIALTVLFMTMSTVLNAQNYDMFFWCSEEGSPMGLSGVDVTIDDVTVTSGFDGLALFEGYAPGDYDYTASKDGYVTQTGMVTIVDENIMEFVVLSPALLYDMFFWCSEEGSPMGLSGVDVTIDDVTVTSGFDGLALFEGYAPGDYNYSANKDGYITQTGMVTIVDENIMEFVVLSPAPLYDMFFWCSEEGSPMGLSGVDVTIGDVTITSGFDGLALFEGYAPGDYDYSASKDGYVTQSGTVTIVDQNIMEFVVLNPALLYDMFFWCSEEGSPMGLSGVDVTIDGVTVTSGFDGLALFEGYAPGDYDYSASKDGYVTQSGSVTIVDENIMEFVVLSPAPLYDMFFWCSEEGSPMGLSGVDVTIGDVTITSGFDGLALFEGYAPGDYDYSASKEGYVTQTGMVTIVDENIMEFVVLSPALLYDMFFWCSEEGSPMGLSGVDVTIDDVTVTSGFDGLALFEGYAPGDYDYSASKDGYVTQSGMVTIVDENIMEFVVLSPALLYDMFFWCSEEGSPMGLSGVDVTIGDVTITSGFDGLALFEGYAPGDYDYSASKDGYITQSGTVTIVDGNIMEFVVLSPALLYDMFFWCSEEGSPMGLSGVDVTIGDVTITSGFDGLALFEGYAPGDYDYTANKDGYVTQTGMVTIVDENIMEFVVLNPAPLYDMFFWCSEEGSPMGLSGVDVTIGDVTITSGFDGLALFEGYASGDYDYSASKDGYVTQTGMVTIVDENIMEFVVLSPVSVITQTYDLEIGYQFISSNVIPADPEMTIVMADILNSNLDFVRNSEGQMLRKIGPVWVNGIGDWIIEEGYLVKMFTEDSFSISGTQVVPTTPISVTTGYQFVSYFPVTPMDAQIAFETLIGDDLDFIRNSAGYMLRKIGPVWVNGIGDAQAGEGYLVKMFANGEIVYPASAKSSGKTAAIPTHFTFEGGNAADPVYTIYVEGLSIGDEIAAYDGDVLIGAMKINSQNAFDNDLPVFGTLNSGQGYTPGKQIILKVWDASSQSIIPFEYSMTDPYNEAFIEQVYPSEDGLYSVVNIKKGSVFAEDKIVVYPNPSCGIINIDNAENSTIQITDQNGRIIYKNYIENNHATINLSDNPAGLYNIVLISNNSVSSLKLIIVK